MTKLRLDGAWLRDFGMGLTGNPVEANDFSDDEAHVLMTLHPDYIPEEPRVLDTPLAAKAQPGFSPGHGRVWARYKGAWLSVDKQETFLGTREALKKERA